MKWLLRAFLVVLLATVVFTPLAGNLWLLLTGNGYEIPEESSVLWFNPTVMNDGSGDWWIYGEDHTYYYFIGDGHGRYKMFPKEREQSCRGFDPTRYETWCP